MKRRYFIFTALGAAAYVSMEGFSSLANALSHGTQKSISSKEFASFGAVHLNITNLEKSSDFWTRIVGMKLRSSSEKTAEFGTEDKTLVVLHETAKTKFKKGYSGLYHFAIHAPSIEEFASMINRVQKHKYPNSPIDHTMSKSLYLDDPDGINIEFTLETPERFKRVVTGQGIGIEGTDGVLRSASERLDVAEVMTHLKDDDITKPLDSGCYIGHIHLYANSVDKSNAFYQKMGYQQFNYMPQFMYADVGAGGDYQHRVAMNSWHGVNRPAAPEGTAGLKHFQINFKEEDKLKTALAGIENYTEADGGYQFKDPTGNVILLKHQA